MIVRPTNSCENFPKDLAKLRNNVTQPPLWNVRSQVIYWWTATEVDGDRAYIGLRWKGMAEAQAIRCGDVRV